MSTTYQTDVFPIHSACGAVWSVFYLLPLSFLPFLGAISPRSGLIISTSIDSQTYKQGSHWHQLDAICLDLRHYSCPVPLLTDKMASPAGFENQDHQTSNHANTFCYQPLSSTHLNCSIALQPAKKYFSSKRESSANWRKSGLRTVIQQLEQPGLDTPD